MNRFIGFECGESHYKKTSAIFYCPSLFILFNEMIGFLVLLGIKIQILAP